VQWYNTHTILIKACSMHATVTRLCLVPSPPPHPTHPPPIPPVSVSVPCIRAHCTMMFVMLGWVFMLLEFHTKEYASVRQHYLKGSDDPNYWRDLHMAEADGTLVRTRGGDPGGGGGCCYCFWRPAYGWGVC